MTRSTGMGRGGKREGAGRKKKPGADIVPLPAVPDGLSTEELAKHFAGLAVTTLATIAAGGASESARVAAAREILDRSEGKSKPGVAANPDQSDMFDGGWGELLRSPSRHGPARKTN